MSKSIFYYAQRFELTYDEMLSLLTSNINHFSDDIYLFTKYYVVADYLVKIIKSLRYA